MQRDHSRTPGAALLALCAAAACTSPPRPPAASTDAQAEIAGAVDAVVRQHLTPVDRGALLRAAARALDEDAAASPPASPPEATAALRDALERHRARRPGESERRRAEVAVAAVARALGDGSRFIDEAERRRTMSAGASDAVHGVGLVLAKPGRFPVVRRVLAGGAGAKAGIRAGVELRAVDGRSTADLSLDEAALALRGPQGSEAVLEVGEPSAASRTVAIRRELAVEHADCRILGGDVLYLRLHTLSTPTLEDVLRFARDARIRTRATILDVRENTGGLLAVAGDLADAFLEGGPILSIEGPSLRERREARPGTSRLEAGALAVLVDGATGSGAEAVAAAIQDDGRGLVVGTATSGRARIETLHPVAGGLLRFPVAALLRASGQPIDGHGVRPDVETAAPAPAATEPADVPCPDFASPEPVGRDPAVARALAALLPR